MNNNWLTWEKVQTKRILERQAIIKVFTENDLLWLLKFLNDYEENTSKKETLYYQESLR